jgi:O-antigen/teichoic acid export membrane protein
LYSSALTTGLSLFIYTRKFGPLQVRQDSGLRKYLFKEAFPLGIGQVIDRFYYKTNFILIRIIRSVTEVGFYGGAYRIIEQLSLIAVSIVTAIFPVFSLLSQSARSSLALAHEKTLKVLAIISLPIVVILSCLSEKITVIIFGANLIEIAQPLRVLSFIVFLLFSNLLFKFTLSAMNKQTIYRRNSLISFFINLILALWLVPVYGYMGACAAILFSFVVIFALGHYSIRKYLPEISLVTALVKPVIGSLVMALVVFLMRHMSVFIVALSGIIVYVLTLIVLKTVTSDEIDTLKRTTIPIQGE